MRPLHRHFPKNCGTDSCANVAFRYDASAPAFFGLPPNVKQWKNRQWNRAPALHKPGNLDLTSHRKDELVRIDPATGKIAAQRNEWEAANRYFLSVVRLAPADPQAYFYLGQTKLYQRQWAGAIQYFDQAARRQYPDPQRLPVELAMARNEAGQSRQALADLERAGTPADPRLAAQRMAVTAFARGRMGEWTAAIEAVLAKFRALEPKR